MAPPSERLSHPADPWPDMDNFDRYRGIELLDRTELLAAAALAIDLLLPLDITRAPVPANSLARLVDALAPYGGIARMALPVAPRPLLRVPSFERQCPLHSGADRCALILGHAGLCAFDSLPL